MNGRNKKIIKDAASIAALIIMCLAAVVFEYLYISRFTSGFIYRNRSLIFSVAALLTTAVCSFAVYFGLRDNDFVYRMCFLSLAFAVIVLSLLYVLQITGFWDKIDSVEDLRAFIADYGAFAVPMFILLQIAQVVVLPIPGFIAVGAGVAMFGSFFGSLYSFIGIIIGSLTAFFIGRYFGYRVASWLVGKKTLDKTLESVRGKDKILLTAMFLFPFFPDDVLCFVAGLSSMSKKYFIIMIIITRIISVFTTGYSLDGKIIPYNTWWGLLIWAAVIGITLYITYLIYKKGEKIEEKIFGRWKKKKDPKKKG